MPLGHVGPGTSMTVDGLNLHLGRTYVSTVRAWIDGDKGKQYSRPTSSDGVKIVDLSPPWIENLRATPAVVLQGGGDSVIEATLYDTTRLARVNVQVSAPDGAIVAKWQRALAVRVHELARPWPGVDAKGDPLPAGTYKVTVVARDGAGHEATASVQITRCAAGEVIVNGGCGTASVQPDGVTGPDVDSDAGASSTVPREPDDDCCSASPTSGPGHLTGLLALLACVLVVFKRRSHWATGPNAL